MEIFNLEVGQKYWDTILYAWSFTCIVPLLRTPSLSSLVRVDAFRISLKRLQATDAYWQKT